MQSTTTRTLLGLLCLGGNALAQTCPHDDSAFFHDFENVSGDLVLPLVGPVGQKSSNIAASSVSTSGLSSQQHLQAPDLGFGHVDTNVRLTASTAELSFSILYNARGDASNRLKRLVSSYDGTGALPAGQFDFDRFTDGRLRVTTANTSVFSDAFIPEDDDWHHVGFTFRDGEVRFYLDGAPFGADKLLGVTEVAAQTYDWHLIEDAVAVSALGEFWWGGSYDEAGLWYRALSDGEMASLANGVESCALSVTSSSPAEALPVSGSLAEQIAELNAPPPDYVSGHWQPVARWADLHQPASFSCAPVGIVAVGGAVVETGLPPTLQHNQWESNVEIRAFAEQTAHVLTDSVTVDASVPGTYGSEGLLTPAEVSIGARVSSYLLHFDTVADDQVTLGGSVTFDADIVGVMMLDDTLNDADEELKLTGITYPTDLPGRGMELDDEANLDDFTISADRRTLTFSSRVRNWMDELRVLTDASLPLAQPFVDAVEFIDGVDEVSLDNCGSAFYRFTFTLPDVFLAPELSGVANVDDQAVLFLNGNQVSGTMSAVDFGTDLVDGQGRVVLTGPTQDPFFTVDPSFFVAGVNELVFAVCGDAGPEEPTGLEFRAAVSYDEPLEAVVDSLSVSAGGTQHFALDAGIAFGGSTYLLAGSLSGTSPGIPLGAFTLPLNFDGYFQYTIANPNSPPLSGSFGVLDPGGQASASLVLPAGAYLPLAGLEANHAFVLLDSSTFAVIFVSNPVSVSLLP